MQSTVTVKITDVLADGEKAPEQWEGLLQTVASLDSRSLGCVLTSDGLACPAPRKELVAATRRYRA